MPPPDDRLWRHPAEVAAEQRAQSDRNAEAHGPSVRSANLAAAVVAAVGGGLLVTGLWIVMSSTSTASVAGAGGSIGALLDRSDAESIVAPPVEQSIVELRSTDGADMGHAVALRTGSELVASLDVASGTRLEAILPDGSRTPATVVGHDELTGISAVRLSSGAVHGAILDASGPLGASGGEPIVTETKPDGWSHATVSIASTDIERGDVVIDDGRVTALITSLTDEGASATPIAVVERVANQLFESGHAAHPWLGVRARDAREGGRVEVTHVVPDSPAARHDITPGMYITGVDDVPVTSIGELLTQLRAHRPGDTVTIEVSDGTAARRIVLDVGDTLDAPG